MNAACSGKERFLTFGLADVVSRRVNNRHAGSKLRPYRCCECGAWHVGSSMEGTKQRGRRMRVYDAEPA